MATFTGTSAGETITPDLVSPTVTTDGAATPGGASDTILGGGGDDTIAGGGGNDIISGGTGIDIAFMGIGNDRFLWSPGDGNDTVEGGADIDTLDFSGSNVAENIDISANASRLSFFRNVAAITMDLHGVENLLYHALGGVDTVVIHDLTGTGVQQVTVDLEGTLGGVADGQPDSVTVNGRGQADTLAISSNGVSVSVSGLPWVTRVRNIETIDTLRVFGDAGKDVITAAAVAANAFSLAIDAGVGADSIVGSVNADVLTGGDGNDTIRGGKGNDIAFLGAGADRFFWKVGDGSDTIEGQGDSDTIDFSGSDADEIIDIAANGGRVRIVRDVDAATLDIDDIERLSFHSQDGADSFIVNSLAGTDVTRIDIDLNGKPGTGQADSVTVSGTDDADTITLAEQNGVISVAGLTQTVFLHAARAADTLIISGGLGADVIDASSLKSGLVTLTINGGDDADTLLGSHGKDVVSGNRGNDVALLGDGDDRFRWFPGDGSDTVEGKAGNDLLDFSGSNVSEAIDISANGERLQFLRNVANIVMDLNEVERLAFHALGGVDTVVVNDLSGTDATQINIALESVLGSGAGDGQADTVFVHGRDGADVVTVSSLAAGVVIDGMPWRVTVGGAEAFDQIRLVTGGGKDSIDLGKLAAGVNFLVDSGSGNDVLTGGLADDVFLFSSGLDAQANVDTIRKFSVLHDTLQLDDGFFTGIGALGTLAESAFHAGATATDAAQRIIYDTTSGKLFFDSDGSDSNEAVLFAKLEAGLALTHANFAIV